MPHVEPIWLIIGILIFMVMVLLQAVREIGAVAARLSTIEQYVADIAKHADSVDDAAKDISGNVSAIQSDVMSIQLDMPKERFPEP